MLSNDYSNQQLPLNKYQRFIYKLIINLTSSKVKQYFSYIYLFYLLFDFSDKQLLFAFQRNLNKTLLRIKKLQNLRSLYLSLIQQKQYLQSLAMKAQQQLIGGRYQYNPLAPLRQTNLYNEYKCYDKVTKRDLVLHIMPRDDRLIQILRDVKHPFIMLVFDVVMLDDGNVAFFYESGCVATLKEVIQNNGYLKEEDALVIVKYILLGIKQLHEKLVVYGRLCLDNVLMCNFSLVKLGYNCYQQQVPIISQSPQLLKGEKVTQASDIFAAGVILYRLIYGVMPFDGSTQKEVLKRIKGKDYNTSYQQGHSPFKICVSKEVNYLLESMLDFYEQNRPSLQQILSNTYMSFPVETDFQAYLKPKINLLPQPFIKKYYIYRASKLMHSYDNYYQEASYLALSTKDKKMVTIYCPQIKMFQAEPRKVQSFFEKLRAIQQNYNEQSCQFLIKLEDVDKFRQEPIFVTEYCNQGDLLTYLQKRKVSQGWLNQKEVNILMYILALAFQQMRQLGVTSIHTINSQRIMIKDKTIKLREPGMIAPGLERKLVQGKNQIDYFAPQLKENAEMVQLDKSDMWSFGVLYYFLLSNKMPAANQEGQIDIQSLKTDQKNRNVIGKCLDYNVQTRLELQNIKLQNVNEDLLQLMLKEKHQHEQMKKQLQQMKTQEDDDEQVLMKDRKVMFKNRKKPLFKDYNKIIAQSSTSICRIMLKTIIGLCAFIFIYFGTFIINGGQGLLRSYYFNPITLQVPYNYGTQLKYMTILTTDGQEILDSYSEYSYQQFTTNLRCAVNQYTPEAPSTIDSFINSSRTVYCLFGFIYIFFFCILYIIYQQRLDLPTILYIRKEKKENNNLFHFLFFTIIFPSLLFCFFYTFAIEYLMQIKPCFGIQDLSYPKFTSIQTLLSGDSGKFFSNVFLTVILWAVLMLVYGYISLVIRKINAQVYDWKVILPSVAIMLLYTVICRVGFGSQTVLQPTWTYKINQDLVFSSYYGFLGLFPQPLFWGLFIIDRIIDFVFWFFLKRGLDGPGEENIKQVKIIQARYEPIDEKKIQNQKSNIYMIEHEFQNFG